MTDNTPATSTDDGVQKQLLQDAAAELQADQLAREKARPKNVGEGTVRLVTDSLGGVAFGTVAAVMGPVEGFKKSGAKGIVTGALGGLATGLASTTLGIGSGISGFVQGAGQSAAGKKALPDDARLLVDRHASAPPSLPSVRTDYLTARKSLYGDLLTDMSSDSATAGLAAHGLNPPVDNELYRVLEVDVNATPAQLRKAYYHMAQKYHPDKHPDDPDATEKFQKISSAYQVLSDPVKREEYHRVGASAVSDESAIDSKTLFTFMFSEFDNIVGDLATATILNASLRTAEQPQDDKNTKSKTATEARLKKLEHFQDMREAHLVKLLNRRLDIFASDEDAFIAHAKLEVLYFREQPFGRECLQTAGYVYRKRSAKLLDHKGPLAGVTHLLDDLGEKAHGVKSQVRAMEGGLKALQTSSTAKKDESIDETARREAVNTLGAVWLASVVDIEHTLAQVVSKVLCLKDKEKVRSAEVKKKAEGLMILGKVFDQA